MDSYIKVGDRKVAVSEAVFKVYMRGERKERYFREGDAAHGVFSYDALDNGDLVGGDLFADPQQRSTETEAVLRVLRGQLAEALETLTEPERRLLLRLYVYEESLRQIAGSEHVAVSTLQYRHEKILKKLKRYFEHTF